MIMLLRMNIALPFAKALQSTLLCEIIEHTSHLTDRLVDKVDTPTAFAVAAMADAGT
jgi:hypothetical protein